jgi:hypothetical protein
MKVSIFPSSNVVKLPSKKQSSSIKSQSLNEKLVGAKTKVSRKSK